MNVYRGMSWYDCIAGFKWDFMLEDVSSHHWGGGEESIWYEKPRVHVEWCCTCTHHWKQMWSYLLDFYVSYFFPCRPAISTISSSCFNLYTTSVWTMPSHAAPHVKSRCPEYPGSKIKRFLVPDDKMGWSQSWPQYNPVSHTDPLVEKKPVWADPDIGWVLYLRTAV